MLSVPHEGRDSIKQRTYQCDLDQARKTPRRKQEDRQDQVGEKKKGASYGEEEGQHEKDDDAVITNKYLWST